MITQKKNFWIIIPAYNSGATLGAVIAKLRRAYPAVEIVVVDDGSSDCTPVIARSSQVRVVTHARNRGVGRAVKTGVQHALESGAEIFVTVGADDQREIADLGKLVDALGLFHCDIVIGSKFLFPGQRIPRSRRLGNILIVKAFNWLFQSNHSDVTSGFRAFNRRVADDLSGLADRYSFDVDLYRRTLERGYRWKEIPVRVFYGANSTRMKSATLVGVGILMLMAWRKFGSLVRALSTLEANLAARTSRRLLSLTAHYKKPS